MDLQAMLYSLAVIYWHHDSMQTPHSFFKQYCEVTLFQLSHPLQAIVFLPRVLFFSSSVLSFKPYLPRSFLPSIKVVDWNEQGSFSSSPFQQQSKPADRAVMDSDFRKCTDILKRILLLMEICECLNSWKAVCGLWFQKIEIMSNATSCFPATFFNMSCKRFCIICASRGNEILSVKKIYMKAAFGNYRCWQTEEQLAN